MDLIVSPGLDLDYLQGLDLPGYILR